MQLVSNLILGIMIIKFLRQIRTAQKSLRLILMVLVGILIQVLLVIRNLGLLLLLLMSKLRLLMVNHISDGGQQRIQAQHKN
jgi:hypothetical protein